MKKPVYKRVVLKLSGEALQGNLGYGIDPVVAKSIAEQIKEVHELGMDLACVIGGGNIFRGLQASKAGMDRSTADYIGMLATIINSMVLQNFLEKLGVHTRVQSAIEVKNPNGKNSGVKELIVDGKKISGKVAPVFKDGKTHKVEVTLS